jgi:hypothetical protein
MLATKENQWVGAMSMSVKWGTGSGNLINKNLSQEKLLGDPLASPGEASSPIVALVLHKAEPNQLRNPGPAWVNLVSLRV